MVNNQVKRLVASLQMFLGLAWVDFSQAHPVFADVQGTLKDVETGLGGEFKNYANIGLGIVLLIYGACRFFGMELAQWAKRIAFGAFVGAIVIVNFDWIRNTVWGWIGG
ncbi:TPA: hypothetical protein ACF1RY_001777 [Enterococcus hirae]|uniref:hypothetical protein n=1 Tax=Enterococcus TaxID=1350 RepID=UPI001A96D0F4|nr:hypothetical protein [Enterococcus hirae]MBO1101786.1 hypothetical protein [Enterococcus hirae]